MKSLYRILAVLTIFLLAACGGGGGGSGGGDLSVTDLMNRVRQALDFDSIRGENTAEDYVASHLTLPSSGEFDTLISWESSDPAVIAADGRVTRPDFSSGDASVVLTASISLAGETLSKQFVLTVPALPRTDAEAVEEAGAALIFEIIGGSNTAEDWITTDLSLITSGLNGTSISWATSDAAVIAVDGTVTRPGSADPDSLVTLTATITRGEESAERTFSLTVLSPSSTDAAAVSRARDALSFDNIRGANTESTQIVADLNLIGTGIEGTSVVWASSDPLVIAEDGTVIRPGDNEGNQSVTLTATISLNAQSATKDFDLVVLEEPGLWTYDYPGTGYGINHLETPETDSADAEISLRLDLGSAPKEVYFIFTNTRLQDAASSPVLARTYPEDEMAEAQSRAEEEIARAREEGIGLRGRADIALFNSDPERYGKIAPASGGYRMLSRSVALTEPRKAVAGDNNAFDDNGATVNATLRKAVSANGKTLNLWVADDSWGAGCSRANCVEESMVDILADKFLLPGDGNDIYEWVTDLYGAEWGSHSDSAYIAPDDNISILLTDIDRDNSTNGGTLGYFWSRDNFKTSAHPDSNERLMFYIDSVMFATGEGFSWDIDDYWPDTIVGTLAHEFSHMIHFYQKAFVEDLPFGSETWLDEMCAMVAEDFVGNKAQILGPRGVSPADGTAGGAFNHNGSLPRYNRYNYLPVAEWLSGGSEETATQNSYSINYAMGAYLARNFGGAELFKNIVQSPGTGVDAIDSALAETGYPSEDFASALRKWGVAGLLSDDATSEVPEDYRYNAGGFFRSATGSTDYDLGSINLYNYVTPPTIYTALAGAPSMAGRYKTSNMLYRLGTGLSGLIEQNLTLRRGTKLTVLIK